MSSFVGILTALGSLRTVPWSTFARRLAPEPEEAVDPRAVRAPWGTGELGTLAVGPGGATWVPVAGRVEWRLPESWSADPGSGFDFGSGPSARIRALPEEPGADLLRCWCRGRLSDALHAARRAAVHGDEAAATHARDVVDDFTRRNPPGSGPHWASAMEVALRSVRLLHVAALLAHAGREAGELGPALSAHEGWLGRHSEWRLHFTGNHFLVATAGRFLLASHLPGTPRRRREARRAWSLFWRELGRQVGSDGLHFESSTHYHLLAAETAAHVAAAGRRAGLELPQGAEERLALMAGATRVLARPDGTVAAVGDSDDGRFLEDVSSPEPPAEGDDARGIRARLEAAAGHVADPPEGAWLGAEGGLAVLRADAARGPVHVTVSATTRGRGGTGGHGHDDAGSYELWCGGSVLVADRGTGSYTGDPALRERLRSVLSHSAVQVDGLDQNPPVAGRPFRRVERAKPFVAGFQPGVGGRLSVGHHGYFAEGVRASILRTFTLLPTGDLEVEDDVRGAGEHEVVLRIQWAPGVELESEGGGSFRLRRGGGLAARLEAEARGEDGRLLTVTIRTLAVPHSPRMGGLVEALATELVVHARLPVRFRHQLRPA